MMPMARQFPRKKTKEVYLAMQWALRAWRQTRDRKTVGVARLSGVDRLPDTGLWKDSGRGILYPGLQSLHRGSVVIG